MEQLALSVLIISYNTREITISCLGSIVQHVIGSRYEVLVAENASTDGSAEMIAMEFPQVQLLVNRENLGFARANNLAAKQANGEYLLLLNPDTVVLDGAILKLLAFARAHPEAGIVGGRTLYADGSLNPTSCWGIPSWWSMFCYATGFTVLFRKNRLFDPESLGSWQRDTVREVGIVTGCLLMIRRDLWSRLGGFDPSFFMYGEDADLSMRVRALGKKCMVCPDATIIHYGGASEKVRSDKMVKLFKAKAQLFDRHWTARSRSFGIFCLDLWALTRMTAFSILRFVRPRYGDSYRTWRDIWRQRSAWHCAQTQAASQAMADQPATNSA